MPSSLSEIQKFLASIQPFKKLPQEDLRGLSRVVREKSFSKGETVYNEGEVADSVWILYKGRVQVFKYVSGGKPFAIESLGPGELFGTLCRLGGDGRCYPCTASAAVSTTCLQLLDKTFLNYFHKSPGFVQGVCGLCSQRLKDVQDLRCMGQEPVPIRIASTLLRLRQVHGDVIPLTKREIAELAGTTVETAFRVISAFQKKGCLSSLPRKIQIQDPAFLKTLIDKL
ncbi:MAG: Crp/Fnr family transcriptional regulator [Elusimicrobia bacterium]|nr:Crp/Fnr family transcriptional regulator [Elusimicrobiota bacterium]